jgi:TonB family protein
MMLMFLLKTSLVLVVASAAILCMRRSTAASRHVVWTTALLAVLLLPITSAFLPALQVPMLLPENAPRPVDAGTLQVVEATVFKSRETAAATFQALESQAAQAGAWAGSLWLLGSALLLVRIGRGYHSRRKLASQSWPCLEARILDAVTALSRRLGIRRPVKVWIATTEMMPATWGIARPALLLPPSALHWSDERLRLVLTHELAHVLRFDAFAHGVSHAAVALAWWNPLIWVASTRAHIERERACDDVVIYTGAAASQYADELLTLAQSLPSFSSHRPALAMARSHRMQERLSAILDPARRRTGTSHLCAVVTSIVLAGQLPLAAAQFKTERLAPIAAPLPMFQAFRAIDTALVVGHLPLQAGHDASPRARTGTTPNADTNPVRNAEEFAGTWEPLSNDADRLVSLWEVGLAYVRGRFTIVQSADSVTVVQTLPEHVAEARRAVSDLDPVHMVFDLWRWKNTNRLEGDELLWQFPQGRPVRFRRVQTGTGVTQVGPQPIHAGNFGAGAYRPGNGVANPTRIREVKPKYTEAALKAGLKGTVELEAVVGIDGKVTDVRVVRSLDDTLGLDENAKDVVRRTPFVPCKIGDRPVACLVVFELEFTPGPPTPIAAGQFGAGAYRPGDGVTNPTRNGAVTPRYTKAAMDAKIEGTVELEAVIGADGVVTDVRVVRSLDDKFGLDENAQDAVRKTSFEPCKIVDTPVACLVVFELQFTLR